MIPGLATLKAAQFTVGHPTQERVGEVINLLVRSKSDWGWASSWAESQVVPHFGAPIPIKSIRDIGGINGAVFWKVYSPETILSFQTGLTRSAADVICFEFHGVLVSPSSLVAKFASASLGRPIASSPTGGNTSLKVRRRYPRRSGTVRNERPDDESDKAKEKEPTQRADEDQRKVSFSPSRRALVATCCRCVPTTAEHQIRSRTALSLWPMTKR